MWFEGGSRNGGADGGGVWGGGIFSFEMVHFDAFWKTMELNCVTTTFSSCTCSTFQQKGRPKIFVQTFLGGGFNPQNPPLTTVLVVSVCVFVRLFVSQLGSVVVRASDWWSRGRHSPVRLLAMPLPGIAAATFQKLWVSIFPSCFYKRPTTAVKGVDGRGMGKGCPLPNQLGSLGSVVSSSN